MTQRLDVQTILGLVGSAIGGCAAVVCFTFLTFQTKSEAQVEQDHTKSEQNNIRDDVHELRATMLEMQKEMNQKLDRLIYYTKGSH